MGSPEPSLFSRHDYKRYRNKVGQCLDVFAGMLDSFQFDDENRMIGLELEIDMVDADRYPAMRNAQFLELTDDDGFKEELGAFNLELNVEPRQIGGTGLADYEQELNARLDRAQQVASGLGVDLVLTGILPTLLPEHAVLANLSPLDRYHQINEYTLNARADDIRLDIRGVEQLKMAFDSVAPEAANTSFQVHLQVTPETFASYWNASQAIACAQVAVAANSPFLFGRRLWSETRVPLFEQAVDSRPRELINQMVRPRVWFGERWVTTIFDLFEENSRYFAPILPDVTAEDPQQVLADNGVPGLWELRVHNGTIYRWNRPVYDIRHGVPHLRVENRVLPAGPTVADMVANAAFYAGLTRSVAEADRPLWSQLPFEQAERNFFSASRHGLSATVLWPQLGEIAITELVQEQLLELAYGGLDSLNVDLAARDRYLGIIEQRCATGRNGAYWQTETVRRLEERGLDRVTALRTMLDHYVTFACTNDPVHTWPDV